MSVNWASQYQLNAPLAAGKDYPFRVIEINEQCCHVYILSIGNRIVL